MSRDRMGSCFNVILFPSDQFVTYSVITIYIEENITVSLANRIFYTPSLAVTELYLDYILFLSLYMCVCVFLVL
jgi:hypothetical protein